MGKYAARKRGTRASMLADDHEEMDPMSSLANLSDCMLVLACGLMVALVVAWNIDISSVTEVSSSEQAKEISSEDIEEGANEAGGGGFVELGQVYQDAKTGKLYMIERDKGSSVGKGEKESAKGSKKGASGRPDKETSADVTDEKAK